MSCHGAQQAVTPGIMSIPGKTVENRMSSFRLMVGLLTEMHWCVVKECEAEEIFS